MRLPVAIMADIKGPAVRMYGYAKPLAIEAGTVVTIESRPAEGIESLVSGAALDRLHQPARYRRVVRHRSREPGSSNLSESIIIGTQFSQFRRDISTCALSAIPELTYWQPAAVMALILVFFSLLSCGLRLRLGLWWSIQHRAKHAHNRKYVF